MALPPEHITIKRRRDDEPVDTLCKSFMLRAHIMDRLLISWSDIQQKRQRPDYHWCRVDNCEIPTNSIALLSEPLSPSTRLGVPRHADAMTRVSVVRATSPSRDEPSQRYSSPRPLPYHQKDVDNAILKPPFKTMAPEPSPPSSVQSSLKRRHSSNHLFRPRTFHLSSSLASSSTPVATIRGTPELKRHQKDLAVFMERTKRDPQAQDTLRSTTITITRLAQIEKDDQKGDHKYQSREIPITSVIEMEGRIDSSIKVADTVINLSTRAPDFKTSSGGGDFDAKITEQQHQIASYQSSISKQIPGAMSSNSQLKIKPKLPKPRPQKKQIESADSSGDGSAEGMIYPDIDDDFVYDTYVRSFRRLAGIPTDHSELYNDESDVDSSKIGILIIPERDQAVWEAFGEEEKSDKDWNSEEEDENGTYLPSRGTVQELREVANEIKLRNFMVTTIRKTKSILMMSLAWALMTIDTVLQTMKNLMKLRDGRMKRVRHNTHGNAMVGGFACRILPTTKIGIIESKISNEK